MDEHVLPTYRRREEVFVSGHDCYLVDREGNEYLDLLSGIGVTALGHAHPKLVDALTDQLGRVTHVSNLLRHEHTEALAGELCALTAMGGVFFCNSGSEANEAALKLARKHQRLVGRPERTSFVAVRGSFHGRTAGALSVTASEAYRTPFGPLLDVEFVEPEDVTGLAAALEREPAAMIVEPLQGESGLRRLSDSYLHHVREFTTATGTVLVHDEVQCGAGRTGEFLAGQHSGIKPDVVTLAKPIGAGIPMGACLVREDWADTLVPGDHGSTFGGGPLASRAALVFLEEYAGGLRENVAERGAQLAEGLDALAAKHAGVAERRGLGLMQGLRVPGKAAKVVSALHARRVLAAGAGDDVVRFLPPYVITDRDVERGLEVLDAALTETLDEKQ